VLTVADAFTGTAALGSAGRGALALVLGGRRTAIEYAPLGDIRDRRHRMRLRDAVVGAARDDGVLQRLADATLGHLLPGTSLLADDDIGAHQCHTKLFNLLMRQQVRRWSTLLGLRVSEVLEWPGAHARTTAEVVGLVFERSLVGLAATHLDATPTGAAVDLAILLDHEQTSPSQPLVAALGALSGQGHPEQVRRAATRLLRVLPPVGGHRQAWDDILAAAGDRRDMEVFAERTLRLNCRPTVAEVAERVGLSAERVRQIGVRAQGRVRGAAAAAPDETRVLVGAVGAWLGRVVPVEVAHDVARRLGAGSAHTRLGGLLLWLAGPYRPVPGRDHWLAVEPAEMLARTTEWLAEDGGVRPAREIHDELAAEGVRTEHHDAWVAACGGVAVDDMVVYTAGGLATVAERALFATGRGMTAPEIAVVVAGRDRVAELHVILDRDRRFVRVSEDVYELADWGGVAKPEPTAPRAAPPPGCTSNNERWWLRIPVDADVLRGAGSPCPDGLHHLVSLVPHHRRTFVSRYGPVTISDDGTSPGLGSLRHVALACGAQPGDELWLGFDPDGDVAVHRRHEDEQRPPAGDPFLVDTACLSLTAQGAR
jgi:hypothetical protein